MRKLFKQTKQAVENVQQTARSAFRGVLNLVKSRSEIQLAQVSGLADETLQDVELMQQFGFTSAPPASSEAVVIPVGGKTTHSVIVATENGAFRVKGLKEGEVAVYDQSGSTIILKQGKLVEISCDNLVIHASQKIALNSPLVEASEVLTAQGQINGNGGLAVQGGNGASFSGDVVQQGGSFSTDGDVRAGSTSLKTHQHNEQGDGQPTSTPI